MDRLRSTIEHTVYNRAESYSSLSFFRIFRSGTIVERQLHPFEARVKLLTTLSLFLLAAAGVAGQELARVPPTGRPRWFSFENQSGGKGTAASTNKGAKGDAWE